MRTTKTVTQEVEETEAVFCNKCGEDCTPFETVDSLDPHGLIEVEVGGGYASPHLEDLTTYTFSLCEACLIELFKGFKIPVATRSYVA